MFRYYLISSWRNLQKNKLVSALNLLGLSIGLTTAVMAIIFARHEMSYEKNHRRSDDIHLVFTYGNLGSIKKIPQTFSPVGSYLKENFPDIEIMAKTRNIQGIAYLDSIPQDVKDVIVAEETIFSILTFNFIQGNKPKGPQEIALTEKMAKSYFGKENPVGKFLTLKIFGQRLEMIVSGVYEDMPSNTHFKASCIIPFSLADHLSWEVDQYHSADYQIYALLHPQTNLQALNSKILEQYELPVKIEDIKVGLVPISRLHLHETIQENNKANLLMLLGGGILALIISCFNYININTILFTTRMKEVGIKKTLGAARASVFFQFVTDTLLAAAISLCVSLIIIYLLLPEFNNLLSSRIGPELIWQNLPFILAVLLITILLAGFYPALGSSKFKPLSLMGNTNNSGGLRKNRLMNTLITFQFLVSVVLLQFIVLIFKQGEYMFRQDVTGYNSDDVVVMDGYNYGDLQVVKAELLKQPHIELVSWGSAMPGADMNMTNTWKEDENKEMALDVRAEEDFLKLFRIGLESGRFIDNRFESDKYQTAVINTLTAQSLGYDQPVGKTMKYMGRQYEIVGVVDNYQAVPPVFADMPLIITRAKNQVKNLFIRVDPKNREQAHQEITQVMRKMNPDHPVNINYFQDIVAEQGKSYAATFTLFNYFVGIIIFNSMLGLFGLSFFVAERKNKEVGVRKVCGATMLQLFWNLAKGFFAKLLLAIIIAAPLIYLAGNQYLTTFPRHINLGPGIFLTGGLLAFLMLFLAAGWKLYEVANCNPSKILRYE